MDIRVSASEAKAHLAELINRVRYGGDRVWIERRGQVVALLVSPDALERSAARPSGAPPKSESPIPDEIEALVRAGKLHPIMRAFGAWAHDESTRYVTDEIYANRRRSVGRRVEF